MIMIYFILDITESHRAFHVNQKYQCDIYQLYLPLPLQQTKKEFTFVKTFRWFTVPFFYILSCVSNLCSIDRIHTPALAMILKALQWMKPTPNITLQSTGIIITRTCIGHKSVKLLSSFITAACIPPISAFKRQMPVRLIVPLTGKQTESFWHRALA